MKSTISKLLAILEFAERSESSELATSYRPGCSTNFAAEMFVDDDADVALAASKASNRRARAD